MGGIANSGGIAEVTPYLPLLATVSCPQIAQGGPHRRSIYLLVQQLRPIIPLAYRGIPIEFRGPGVMWNGLRVWTSAKIYTTTTF